MIPTIQELPSRSKRGPSESNNEGGFVSRSQEPATRNRSTRSRSTGSGAQDSAAKSSGADESSTSGHKKARSRSNLQHTAQPEQIGRPAPAQNSAGGTTALPTPRGDQGAFDILLEVLDWAYGELAPTKTGITMSKLLNKLYFAFKFPNFKNGQTGCHRIPVEEVIHYNASTLIDTLDASKWGDHDFYAELQKMAKTELKPIALKPSDFPYFIVPRSRSSKQPGASSQPSQAAAIVVGGSSHQDGNNDTSFEGFETPKRAGKGVKTPGRLGKSSLRPAASSKKRPRSDVDSDSESESRDAKRSHYFYDTDDTMDDADTNGHGLRDEDEDQVKIVLRADKIPSTVPHGPDGTWTCDQEDCNYIVRGGDAEECQERIRQHFKGHEQQTERVQLAVTESRGHLPIKYAYFPPFLLLVHMDPPPPPVQQPPSPHPEPPLTFPSPSLSAPGPSSPPLDLSRSFKDDFHRLVSQFKRKPHPVQDRIDNLTTPFQPPPRQDQVPR